jgi:hypothetical protein
MPLVAPSLFEPVRASIMLCVFVLSYAKAQPVMITCASISELTQQTGSAGATCLLLGYDEPGDGGGGLFFWQQKSSLKIDQGTVFAAKQIGCWSGSHCGQPGSV